MNTSFSQALSVVKRWGEGTTLLLLAERPAARPGKRLSSKVEGGGGEGNKVEIRLGAIPSKCAEMSFDPLSHDVSSKILPSAAALY